MTDIVQVGHSTIALAKADITDIDIDAFVYYARPDLVLGSGFGTAIAMRGGRSIQEELTSFGVLETTQAVVSSAGELKADYIIHAVGPRFQEENLQQKLKATVLNCLKQADSKGIKRVAFPPMGVGFYGVPLDVSAEIMFETMAEYLSKETGIKEVVICLLDSREYKPFQKQITSFRSSLKEAI